MTPQLPTGAVLDGRSPQFVEQFGRNLRALSHEERPWYYQRLRYVTVRTNLGCPDDDIEAALAAHEEINGFGFELVAGVGHILDDVHGVVGTQAWLSRATWRRASRALTEYLARIPFGNVWLKNVPFVQLDMEPYWKSTNAPRYLKNTRWNRLRLRYAMRPLTAMLRRLGVTVLAMPGGYSYLANLTLERAGVPVVHFDETTYNLPFEPYDACNPSAAWRDFVAVHDGPPCSVMSGFRLSGMRDDVFLRRVDRASYGTPCWWYVNDSAKAFLWRFGTAEWIGGAA